ncbi:MAG: zf-HC2 domain-containing protein [Acidobacteria bacterium]|nr:zf-HC2 domain-containing protein [Acidobacteriota bacterium]
MNDKTNHVENDAAPRACERAEELVTYLYGETSPKEAVLFRQHLSVCAACRDDLAAFASVRQSVGEWRAEALSLLPSLAISQPAAPRFNAREANARQRSALAAIREFFSLSPLWMQAGAVVATLLLCALAALTVARTEIRWDANGVAFQTGVSERVIEKERIVEKQVPGPGGYMPEQVSAMIEERVNNQVAIERAQWRKEQEQKAATSLANATTRKTAPRTVLVAGMSQRRPGRQSSSPGATRRDQFIVAENNNDEALPRLTDLLGEVKEHN